jgi:hypothetical protein
MTKTDITDRFFHSYDVLDVLGNGLRLNLRVPVASNLRDIGGVAPSDHEHAATALLSWIEGKDRGLHSAAIEFSIGFYDALASGRSIEISYRFGCNAIQMAGIPQHLIPVLLRKKDRHLPLQRITGPQ